MSNRTKRLSRLGNAVVPRCAEWIGRRLMDAQRKDITERREETEA